MKQLLLIILFSTAIFGQSGKSVLTQAQKDSIGAMIRDSSGYVTPENYGAVGDGVTNDSAAVVNALKSGKPVKGISGKTYLVNNASVITLTGYNIDLSSTGGEPFTIQFADKVNGFEFYGTTKTSGYLLKDSVIVGTKKLVFTSTANVDTGDLILIFSPAGDYWTALDTSLHIAKADYHLVNKISGDTVFIDVPMWDTYDKYNGSHPATVYVYNPITVKMENIVFKYTNTTDADLLLAIKTSYTKNDIYEDVTIDESRYIGLQMWYAYGSKIIRPTINFSDYVGLGYGIYLAGGFDVTIEDGYFNNCRSGIDGGTIISRSHTIRNNSFTTDRLIVASRGFGIHLQSQNWVIENNRIYAGYNGINIAGEGHIVKNNYLFNIPADPIYLGSARNVVVDGNVLDINYANTSFPLSSLPICFVRLSENIRSDDNSYINIINNVSNLTYESFVITDTNAYHLNISGNTFKVSTNNSYILEGTGTDSVYYSTIAKNTYSGSPTYRLSNLSKNITFISSYTEFHNTISNITDIDGGVNYTGSLTANGIDLDSLANITSVFNVSEDLSVASYITNGTCEGSYTAGLAPNVTSAGTITPSEKTGYAGSGQGFTSTTWAGNGNINFSTGTPIVAGTQYKLSFYAKRISGGTTQKMMVYIYNNFWSGAFIPTTSFQKFEYTFIPNNTISSGVTLRFGNYTIPDTAALFVIDNIEVRPLTYETSVSNMIIDSTLMFKDIDSLPYAPIDRVKIGNVGGELKARDTGGNEFILTNFPPVTIPSDSTGLPTGALYYRGSDGIIRRKY